MPESQADASAALSTHLCWLLSRASYTLTTELAAALESVGLTPREHEVLTAAAGGEHTQGELGRIVGLDKTTMVVTLDELEAAGLAERRPSPSDRRVRVIAVTAAGRRKCARADQVISEIHRDVLAALPAAERKQFMRSLARLVNERLAEPVATPQPIRRRGQR